MSEPGDIERQLMLARRGLAASGPARDRVLAGLSREIPALASLASAPTSLASMSSLQAPSSLHAPTAPSLSSGPAVRMAVTGNAGSGSAPFWSALRLMGLRGVGLGGLLVAAGFSAGYVARGSSNELTSRAGSTIEAPGAAAAEPVASSEATLAREPALAAPLVTPTTTQPAATQPAGIPPEREHDAARLAPARAHLSERRASRPRHEPSPESPEQSPLAPAGAERTGLERELSLLRRAERALRKGNPEFALALLDELEANGPSPMLSQERSATRLLAACQARSEGAERAASAFIAAHPESVYVARLESSCRALHSATERERSPAAGAPAPAALPPAAGSDGSPGGGH